MTELHDLPLRDRWARLRFAIVGPLLSAPPETEQLRELITALATKRWRHPVAGDDVQFGRSTVERWFYRARKAVDNPVGRAYATESAPAVPALACRPWRCSYP